MFFIFHSFNAQRMKQKSDEWRGDKSLVVSNLIPDDAIEATS